MSHDGPKTIRVAAVQAEPEWNNLQKGVEKTIRLIIEAGKNGANVMGFPEVWIPGYPWSIWNQSVVDNVEFMVEYFRNSLERDSEEMNRIRCAVKEAGIFCVLGYSERYQGSLYISQSFIDENGDIVHHRRKIKPTHVERGFWGEGQADSLKSVVKSSFGNIGGLNCWEHTQTLLRYYEYAQNVDIHIASWPLIFGACAEMQYHISSEMCGKLTQVMSMEGACFTLICSQVMSAENCERNKVDKWSFVKAPGGGFSMIYGPAGEPLVEAPDAGEEVILYADVELAEKWRAKQNLDVVGHYSRPDLLSLKVTNNAASQVHFA
ncbi:nitrilase [Aspergillus piperis CBS 112811]|uniref:nitrilase n=1 Tax=Aspergillus piperis CBS 112811 TaxID=1448313 RepID=A0A8G1QV94_9EURO|nr:nitrilase [Aspergillus piperis CBS 112811]RAH54478.1 nitrilase [Aspergillus piperis CBS 112811]